MLRKRMFSMIVTAVMLTTSLLPAFCFASPAEKTDWNASWIWDSVKPSTLPEEGDVWTNFRKTFTLDSVPSEPIYAKIAAESRYWLYINGELAVFEGGLKRGIDRENGYYDKVDISKYLKVGKNTFAVSVWYYGVAGTASGDSRNQSFTGRCAEAAGFMFEADIGDVTVITDNSWKAKRDSAYLHSIDYETELPNYRFLESNIYYDAKKAISDDFMSWTASDYDDSSWSCAVVRGSYGDSPWNKLYERGIPLIRFDKEIQQYKNPEAYSAYTDTATTEEVKLEMVLPYNAQVTAYLEVEAQGGKKIDIRTDTYTYSTSGTSNSVKTAYITKDGRQTFESLGWFSGEKVIYTIPAGVKILSLGYRESGYDADFTGSFVSDDPALNTLWQKAVRTLYVTMRDNYMDCPDRERAQWWGDVTNEMYMTFYSLDKRSWELYEKGLYTKLGFIQNDILYTVVPNTNYYAELPMQELAGVVGVWEYYMHSGREYIIEDFYEAGKNYLYLWNMQKNGLIEHRPYSASWHNWCDWGSNQDVTVIENAWYYRALDSVINMARLLGKDDDISELELRKSKIAAAFSSFWTQNGFMSQGFTKADDRANALAVLAGLTTDSQNEVILQNVFLNDECYFASPYMEIYVLEAMMRLGAVNEAQARIKTRYDEMINSDISTLYEYWSFPEKGGSKNHAWTGGPLVTMSKEMAGISPLESGYTKYQIKPSLGSLNSVDVSVPSAIGDIKLKMSRDASGAVTMDVTAPEGGEATVAVPRIDGKPTLVSVNGTPLFDGDATQNNVTGVVYSKNDSDYIYFNAAAGTYKFVTTLSAEQKDEYALGVSDPDGGSISLTVGGSAKEVPFDGNVSAGTEITLTATPDAGYRFIGFVGSVGSHDSTLTFNAEADVSVSAVFEKKDADTRKCVKVNIPDGSDVNVTYGNTPVFDGDIIKVNAGEQVTLTACDGERFKFVCWQGDIFTTDKTVSVTVTDDVTLCAASAHNYITAAEAGNVSGGASVTSSHGQTIGTWNPSGLTDGDLNVGFTSTQQSATTPQWIVVDLGESKQFNSVTLYPRVDELCNFPDSFKISVSQNGSDYSDFSSHSNVSGVRAPYICSGGTVSARYIRIDITKLGTKSATEGNPRLQIMELEAAFLPLDEVNTITLSADTLEAGTGHVLVNGIKHTLPAAVDVSRDRLTVIEAVADSNCAFAGIYGDINSTSPVTYLYAKNDMALTVAFSNKAPTGAVADNPANLALGATATASGTYYTTEQWRLSNLTDGVYETDAGFSSKTSPANPYDIVVDLGSAKSFDTVVMYARNSAVSSTGYCSYYPSAFTISVSGDGQNYKTVKTVTNESNILPKNFRRVYGLDEAVNARYIKISVTGLGLKENGSNNMHIQIKEIEVYNIGNLLAGANATDSAGNFQSAGASWYTGNITDGYVQPVGSISGWSTKDLANSQDISQNPHFLTLDMGTINTVDRVVLYGRTDDNAISADSGICPCYPENFEIQVSVDGVNYRTVKTVAGEAGIKHTESRRVYELDSPVTVRYIRIKTTKLGASTAKEAEKGIYRIQLHEIQAFCIDRDYTAPTLTASIADGNKNCNDVIDITLGGNAKDVVMTVENEDGSPSDIADIVNGKIVIKSAGTATLAVREGKARANTVKAVFTAQHSFTTKASNSQATPADCDNAATYYVQCDNCNAIHTTTTVVVGEKNGHSFTTKASNSQATPADCDNAATYYVQCDNCDAVHSTMTVPVGEKNGHSFTTKASNQQATPADCDNAATYYVQCDNCNAVHTTITVAVGEKNGHAFNEKDSGQKADDATCKAPQKNYVQCDNCNAVSDTLTIEVGSKADHVYENYVSNNDATCQKNCTETGKCIWCEAPDTRDIADTKVDHKFENYVSDNNATCQKNCTETAKCKWCDEKDTRDIADSKVDHKFENYVSDNNATCCKDGTKTAKCKWCDEKDTVADANTAKGHGYTTKVFKDVAAGKWYVNAINYNYTHKFISGMKADEFGVNTEVTRGMFITILARIAGVDTSDNKVTTKFTDVESGKYFTAAIKWASENKIVNGMTATTFAPNAPIQRQQLCVMIVNFAKHQKIELTASEKAISFKDGAAIGNYAKDAVATCQMADIVNGYANGDGFDFKPTNTATRAEAAQILYKFHKDFVA